MISDARISLETFVFLSTDYWDPTRAAAAGAGFAGVFTAIVLVVGAELALRGHRTHRSELPEHERYVLAPTVTAIVLLAIATYLYVLLSGEPNRVEMPGLITYLQGQAAQAGQFGLPAIDVPTVPGLVRSSARLFAIAGSTLAVGIVMSAFVVVFLVLNVSRDNDIGQAVLGLYLVGAVLLAVFLLWGYHDAGKAFQGARAKRKVVLAGHEVFWGLGRRPSTTGLDRGEMPGHRDSGLASSQVKGVRSYIWPCSIRRRSGRSVAAEAARPPERLEYTSQ